MKTLQLGAAILAIAVTPSLLFGQRASPAGAQLPPSGTRIQGDGLWFGAGVGKGFAQVSCNICRGWRSPATTGWLRMGARLKPRLLIGAEGSGWLRSENQVNERMWSIAVAAQYYLRRTPRLFVKTGFGVLSYHIDDTQETLGANAFALQVGAGYDLPVSGRFFITPSMTLSHGLFGGTLKFNGAEVGEKAGLTLIQLGVGITRK